MGPLLDILNVYHRGESSIVDLPEDSRNIDAIP